MTVTRACTHAKQLRGRRPDALSDQFLGRLFVQYYQLNQDITRR